MQQSHALRGLLFLLHLLSVQCLIGQVCPGFTVDAGPDITICSPGDLVNLNGIVTGNFSSVTWSPDIGFSNPNSANTSVFVGSTTTFTLTATGSDPTQNLIVNSDFSAGLTNFTSDYIPGTGGPFGLLSGEGQYAVSTDPALTHNNFASCSDQSGDGNMLVVNGATTPNQNVWCQTVNVNPFTDYDFSAYLTSVISDNPAFLQFAINGSTIGSSFNLSSATCAWSQFNAPWNSGSNTSAQICIVNLNTAGGGNDFAIDNITFGPVCSATDDVTVTVVDLAAVVDPMATLGCIPPTFVTLNGNGSTIGPDVTYQWTTPNGNIISGQNTLNPVVDAPGTYTLMVTLGDGSGNCVADATVTVDQDLPPIAVASALGQLDCFSPSISLSSSGSSVGPNIFYNWTTSDGTILSGSTTENPVVGSPGTYTLEVTDASTNCTTTAMVTITNDANAPTAIILFPDTLTCQNTNLSLDASTSTGNSGLAYNWSTSNGSIIGASDGATVIVDAPGLYSVLVTDQNNGCTDSQDIQVYQSTTEPGISIDPATDLSCAQNTSQIQVSPDSIGFSYSWTTSNGNILGDDQSANITANAAGTYIVLVTNTQTGCTSMDSIVINSDDALPTASIAPADSLNCNASQITLDASASSQGTDIVYSWTSPDGNIVSGANTNNPIVDQIGLYVLEVLDTSNACLAVDSLRVFIDTIPPIADAGLDIELTCNTPSVSLDGSGSSQDDNISYQWTTLDGNILSGDQGLIPDVSSTGTYLLTVINDNNGCQSQDSVTVTSSIPITLSLDQADTLNCQVQTVSLNANLMGMTSDVSLLWSTTTGNILTDPTTNQIDVDLGAWYIATAVDSLSGCVTTDSVLVQQNLDTPTINFALPDTLTCNQTQISIDATGSITDANTIINWSQSTGGFMLDDTLQALVNTPGFYILTLENSQSFCSTQDSILVVQDTISPMANAGPLQTLDCGQMLVDITGSGSSQGGDPIFSWSTVDGNILSGSSSNQIQVDAPGTYLLLVEDQSSGCTDQSTVQVNIDTIPPTFSLANPEILTCSRLEVDLTTNEQLDPSFTYQWSTMDGNILNGEDTELAQVDFPGSYLLEVTNPSNSCNFLRSVQVSQDTIAPVISTSSDDTLSCTLNQLTISVNADPGTEAMWTSIDGNFVSGQDTFNPIIDAAGSYTVTVTNPLNGCTSIDGVDIFLDDDIPIANAGPNQVFDCLTSSLQLLGDSSSAGPNITYLWTTMDGNIVSGATTLNPNIDLPGTYILEVVNQTNNCSNTATVVASIDTIPPMIDAGPDLVILCGDSILQTQAIADGDFLEYTWSSLDGAIVAGPNTLTPSLLGEGTYFLEVLDLTNGCSSMDFMQIGTDTIPPSITILEPMLLNCRDSSLVLDASLSSDGPEFIYSWTTLDGDILGGIDTDNPLIGRIGTYQLSILNTDNNCLSQGEITVNGDYEFPIAEAGPLDILDCNNTSLNVDGTGSSTGPEFLYEWFTTTGNIISGGTTLTPEVDLTGWYILEVENDGNGCISQDSVFIDENFDLPQFELIDPEQLTCLRDTVSPLINPLGDPNDLSYLWTTTDGQIVAGENGPNPFFTANGTYSVEVVLISNGCSVQSSVEVIEDRVAPQALAQDDLVTDCNFTTTSLSVQSDGPLTERSYAWQTLNGNILSGANSPMPLVNAIGIYEVLVTNLINGCTSTDQLNITALAPIEFDFLAVDPTCSGGLGNIQISNVMEGAGEPYIYSIDGGQSFQTTPFFNNLEAGTYELVVQDINGCETADATNLIPATFPEVVIAPVETVVFGETTTLFAQVNINPAELVSIEWTPSDDLSCSDCLTPVASPFESKNYRIEVQTIEGCRASALVQVLVDRSPAIYAPNVFSPNGDGSNDLFYLFSNQSVRTVRNFSIYNRWGESIFQMPETPPNDPRGGWDGTFRGQLMNPGVFIWYAEVEFIDGTVQLFKGDVTLIN